MTGKTGRMSVMVKPEKQAKLEVIAKQLDRSRNWVVKQAIDNYLDMHDHLAEKTKEVDEKYPSVKF